ncbi:cullin-3A-like [Musa acuminata AAA Group]|uniref:cullin-3A-like n=1 Tax=Musa acuminata AAA Group TaxID=214697 RepID=UPI0031DF0C3A
MSHHPRKSNFGIEPFKNPVILDPGYADKTWKMLEHGIRNILNNNYDGLSFEVLHRNAYNMALHRFGEKLYSGLVTTLTRHLQEVSASIEAARDDQFLEELNRRWFEHYKALTVIRDVLALMDTAYVSESHKTPVLRLGLVLWRDNVINSKEIQARLPDALLRIIQRERMGEVIIRDSVKNTKMLMEYLEPSLYEKDFEKPFLDDSAIFYAGESQVLIECCDCREYLKMVERRLREEKERASHYLADRTEPKILSIVEEEMIAKHMRRLVHMDSGLVSMLLRDEYEDLGRMYSLLRRCAGGVSTIRDLMTSHLRETGKQLVTDAASSRNPVDLVQRLLDKKDKYDKIITGVFGDDKTFQTAVSTSFEYFINLNSRSPEFISLYVDDTLRKVSEGDGGKDVEIVLHKAMTLFRYLQEKDVFEKYHKQNLANRLLSGRAVSDDAETSLIVKLRVECGHNYTSKLEEMLTDIKFSQDIMRGFYASQGVDEEAGEGPTLAAQVLTGAIWPSRPSTACKLPDEIHDVCEKFRAYYLGSHACRKLTWQTDLGTADVVATFGNGQKHELNVSTSQMCVLVLFNSADRLSCKDIQQATAIPLPDLKRCLWSLACVPDMNVLCKNPTNNDIAEDDVFCVNDNFTSNLFQVKIDTAAAEEKSESEQQEIRQKVEEARKDQIDAAIIRVMKAQRVLNLNSLVTEVAKQLQPRVLPDPAVIKKRVESLIEREYLEDNKNQYQYIA